MEGTRSGNGGNTVLMYKILQIKETKMEKRHLIPDNSGEDKMR